MTELFEAAKEFYNATIGDTAVTVRTHNAAKRDFVIAAADRLRAALQASRDTPADQRMSEGDPEFKPSYEQLEKDCAELKRMLPKQ